MGCVASLMRVHVKDGGDLRILTLSKEEAVSVIRSLTGQLAGMPDAASGSKSFVCRDGDLEPGYRLAVMLGPDTQKTGD